MIAKWYIRAISHPKSNIKDMGRMKRHKTLQPENKGIGRLFQV